MSSLAEKRRVALLTVNQRYSEQRELDRPDNPWGDPRRLITRRPDGVVLIDGKTEEELQRRR